MVEYCRPHYILALGESHYMSAHTIYQYTDYGIIWQVDTVFEMHWCGISFHSTWLQELVKWCLSITSVATSEGKVCRSRRALCYYNLWLQECVASRQVTNAQTSCFDVNDLGLSKLLASTIAARICYTTASHSPPTSFVAKYWASWGSWASTSH